MDIFKLASQKKLRFNTSKGSLSTEQLWDLSIAELDALAVSLQEEYETSGKKSFIVKRSVKDRDKKLQFDIALEILTTKSADAEAAAEALENKQFDQKILQLIAEKQDENLKGKSVAELKRMLKGRED